MRWSVWNKIIMYGCVSSICSAGIEGLSQFQWDGIGTRQRFINFVERYFVEFPKYQFVLHDPHANYPAPQATSTAEHLYKYFRSGLAHSFCIEWGGLLHREDGATDYLFETRQGTGGESALGIVPRELVTDFVNAVDRFFCRS